MRGEGATHEGAAIRGEIREYAKRLILIKIATYLRASLDVEEAWSQQMVAFLDYVAEYFFMLKLVLRQNAPGSWPFSRVPVDTGVGVAGALDTAAEETRGGYDSHTIA